MWNRGVRVGFWGGWHWCLEGYLAEIWRGEPNSVGLNWVTGGAEESGSRGQQPLSSNSLNPASQLPKGTARRALK